MVYEIKHRYSGAVLFSAEVAEGIYAAREALQKAVEAKAYLIDADLRGANLSDANLSDANLISAIGLEL